ncbi:MAG TPA: FAD-dependent oxidoreductase [Terrimicrobiaceae bacterium]
MNTIAQREMSARVGTSTLNPDALKAAEDRRENTRINISKETTENLKRKVKGQIVLPSDPSYDEVREIWNAMIERRPALIVRCAEAGDVPHAISFARESGLEISIRGGGHNIAGNALCDNGVMIDFSTMRNVRVDAEKKRAYVEPGATLADFDVLGHSRRRR